MAAPAPFCNVTVFTPEPNPSGPKGFRVIPPGATLQQVIDIVNQNFSPQAQAAEFDRQVARDLRLPLPTGFRVVPSKGQIPKAIDDKIKIIHFTQKAIVRRKFRVTNPEDQSQYVIDDRVVSMVMTDKSGATWTWQDKNVGQNGEPVGNEERINSA